MADSPWWASVITVAVSGGIGAGAAYATAKMTHRLERARSRENHQLMRTTSWADLQVQAALEAQKAVSSYWDTMRNIIRVPEGLGMEPAQYLEIDSQVILQSSRLENEELRKRIRSWYLDVHRQAEKARQGHDKPDIDWYRATAREQLDLVEELGREARRIHHEVE